MKKDCKLITLFGLIIILGYCFLMIMHEQVHVQIYESYGINSKVEYFKDFPHITTHGDKSCPSDECTLAHNINEAIGYQLQVLYFLIGFGLLIIMALLQNKNMEEVE